MKAPIVIALIGAAAVATSAAAQRPVVVGTSGPDNDACNVVGTVANLNSRGDNYVAVRAAPEARAPERDRLRAGQRLYVCNTNADESWLAVVYNHGQLRSCGVNAPVVRPYPYRGPCRWGWVSARYVHLFAG